MERPVSLACFSVTVHGANAFSADILGSQAHFSAMTFSTQHASTRRKMAQTPTCERLRFSQSCMEVSRTMKPTEILKNEHRVIERVLDCLEKMVKETKSAGRLDAEGATNAVDFFRTFADHYHHGKEEVHLFPAMEAKGFSPENGPTGVMRSEHDQGRAAVRGMAESIDAAAQGETKAVQQFCRHARRYLDLLREHINKEDHCLYVMADNAFSDTDQQELLAKFEAAESHEIEPGTQEKYLRIADELADRYHIAQRSHETTDNGQCGCSS